MPKYLTISSLTEAGLRGTLKEGGTARREAIRRATERLGGKLEAYYYAFGDHDVFSIVDLPDNLNAAAASMIVGAAGAARTSTVVLITAEEMDAVSQTAAGTASAYQPPSA
ncbi:MAG TPA: GYD domain-containing protein [Candidatus Binatia bacterium]|nr:GYD domain-containing protein [Candidatus Binatia bacterium]